MNFQFKNVSGQNYVLPELGEKIIIDGNACEVVAIEIPNKSMGVPGDNTIITVKKIAPRPRSMFATPSDDELVDVPKDELRFELWWDFGGEASVARILLKEACGRSLKDLKTEGFKGIVKEACRVAWKESHSTDRAEKGEV